MLKSSERLRKVSVEVVHIGCYDLIVNKNVDSRSALQFVRKKLTRSDPSEWGGEDDRQVKYEPPQKPKFVIKDRANNRDFFRSVFLGEWEKHRDAEFGRESNYAVNSVLNEIILSLPIANVVNNAIIQELVKSYGFKRMKYVPALLGIIDRRNGDKYVVYKYVKGLNDNHEDMWPHKFNGDKAHALTENLEQLMRDAGIKADDLFPRQLIVNEETIYLVDAEEYWKIH